MGKGEAILEQLSLLPKLDALDDPITAEGEDNFLEDIFIMLEGDRVERARGERLLAGLEARNERVINYNRRRMEEYLAETGFGGLYE